MANEVVIVPDKHTLSGAHELYRIGAHGNKHPPLEEFENNHNPISRCKIASNAKDKVMKSEVGLWIDHRKAVIVTIVNEVEVTREVRSNLEKHIPFSSGSRSKATHKSQGPTAEDTRDRLYGNHLGGYYEGIISLIRGADSIWIFGPGEAKVELETRLKHEDLGGRIVGIDTVDKMTDMQIAAKVRGRFSTFL